MKKLVIAMMLALLLFAVPASGSYGRRAYLISIVDVLHEKNTEVTSITVNIAGSTVATIYANASTTTAATNPIVDSSTSTDITTLTTGYVVFWYAGATCDIILSDGTYTKTYASVNPRNTRLMFDSVLYTAMTEFELLDAESISFGTDDDWVAQSAVAKILTWTPLADDSTFNIGTSGTSLNSSFNVYVGTLLGLKLDASVPSLAWDGGAATINHNSNFNVGLCTGTSTGAINFGGAASGAITVDTAGAIAMNCAGTFGITTDGAATDITVDATTGRVIIDGGEAAADAIVIQSTGGGLDLTAIDNIDMVLTAAASNDDFKITQAGSQDASIHLLSAGTSNDAISLITSAGGIDITVAGAAAGEDLDLTSNMAINLTSSEAADSAIVIATSNAAGQIVITSTDTTVDGIDINASGGIDIDAADDITIDVAGASGQDIIVTNTAGSIIVTATEDIADGIYLHATTGGIDITADGAAAKDLDLVCTNGSVNISSGEAAVADGIVITASNESIIDVKGPVNLNSTYCLFEDEPVFAKWGKDATPVWGGACTGGAGDENVMAFPSASFIYHIIGTQTLLGPQLTAAGLDIAMDLTADEGLEITPNILGRAATGGSRQAFIIDTDAFYLKVKIYVTDVSGTDDLLVGFRKVEAFQAAVGTYTDYAALKAQSGDIYIESDLNGAAAATDDTTDNWGDTTAVTLGIFVDVTGAVTYTIDGSAPTSTQAFTFDTTDVVTPFIYMIHDADFANATYLQSWECGLQY